MYEYYFKHDSEEDRQTIIEAYCLAYNYQEEIEGENMEMIPNPESKEEFAMRMVAKPLIEICTAYWIAMFDKGVLPPEEYSLGKDGFRESIKTRVEEKITLEKRDVV